MFNVSFIGIFVYKEVMSNDTINFNANISDAVEKDGRIFSVVTFILTGAFRIVRILQ